MPQTRKMKEAAKLREETFPLMLLAKAKGYFDSSTFRLPPKGFPKIDAIVSAGADTFPLQITIADPICMFPDGSFSNGGYDERLVREALNNDGIVHGLAPMRRHDGVIASERPMKSFDETFEACVRGIVTALRRKIDSACPEVRLLVDARGYRVHAIDFPFARVVETAFDLVGRAKVNSAFGGYYIVDEGSFADGDSPMFFERVP